MKDTYPEIEALYDQMIQDRLPEERALMGISMHDFSKQIVSSQLSTQDTPSMMTELFLRFYGEDFDAEHRKKIVRSIKEYFEMGSSLPS